MIHFNEPYIIGKELQYIEDAVLSKKISGNGKYTQLSQQFFEDNYNFRKSLLTTSCTDALEMASILTNIQPGDEVIIPSYTFVSTANAFVLRGAKIVFADSEESNPNIDANIIEDLITSKTKAIVPVHYAGVACDMDKILEIAKEYNVYVIEDAAQAVDSFYKGNPLGGIGDLGAFSFHETKNIIAGEGGMLTVNNSDFEKRAEIIWEKGTNRSAFFRGEVDKYGWVDTGSSFLPSEIVSAFLFAQLENLRKIQDKRVWNWNQYYNRLKPLEVQGKVQLPYIPNYATNNGHMFYMLCSSLEERSQLISFLKKNEIHAVFHYLSLHKSPFYINKHDGRELVNCDRYANTLVRLPAFYELTEQQIERVCNRVIEFYS